MSLLGRALAGAGAGVASIASRYIDEDIAKQRAQFLADLQVQTSGRIDDLKNDPTRRARAREQEVLDTRATTGAKNEVELAGEIAKAKNPELRQATIDNATAQTPVLVDRARQIAAAQGYELAPGQQRVVDGKVVAENKRLTSAEATLNAYREGFKGKAGDKPFKLDEDTKIIYNDLAKQQEKLQDQIDKASLDPASRDAKTGQEIPALTEMRRRVASLEMRKIRLLGDAGVMDGAADAKAVVTAGASPEDLQRSIAQAKAIGGKYAADAVPVFEAELKKGLTVKNTPPNAGPQPFSARAGDKVPAKGLYSRALDYLGDLGQDYTSDAGKAALARRVQEASAGGTPLTAVERLRAQQAGML